MARKDLYKALGVPREADAEDIRKAYRHLARQYHPDVNPGDTAAEDRFKEVSEAYAVLSDDQKRRDYDEFGEVSLEGGFDREAARRAREAFGARFGAGGEPAFAGEGYSYGDLDEMLSHLFGRAGHAGGPTADFAMRGADLESELELEFLEAARGTEKQLALARPDAQGGVVRETVTVRIPPGVDTGGRIRVAGKGSPGIGGGPAGDLYAKLRVRPHPVFRRDGRDLSLTLPVTLSEAALGAKIDVPTLDGKATVTVPAGTDGGTRLRLRGKGVPGVGSTPDGDLYVVVQIRVPRDLDDRGREAVGELARFEPDDPREKLGT